ncbi:MAG: prolipoprotein diacylglyceryl transferase [Silicimonas sp.]|jgi:phosphatidylglycerol:prolipoprotein diacylglycerol transferase|uniref:Phosphatidylglycerol--prolipoprotein diacylglyceryl transferase n=1 Tax=Roseovarius atlanticus TaxID=1641875 RepID=A0A0T5NN93_9RHOB|nr:MULTISPECIES: prolipoprotein diacylglyceryl transferase [Roseovarius]KZY39382.1 prolipoprotein diacylglyceryl transferase [Roseovarius sp. HI0049]KRS10323.1 diacylglyceryl transferase [Roseovarius atlanticus]QFT83206.1 Prolipoprotein diacylglyceryl transferase [Roseovarius sp. THAF27]QFT95292.1 Prolipoprotein diacylglyceryl transferase [Roseovarius sp. THAF9]QFT99749.1 Prolipoprotein diacylglyceryl transferase [Roseovarius sp. THAF8]
MLTAALPFPDIGHEVFSIDIWGFHLALRWYALAYIVGIVTGWRICVRTFGRPALWSDAGPPMKPAQLDELLTWIILGVIIGGRLGFVLFYEPQYYLKNPLEILMVWQGGMSFHGGFLGVTVAGLVFCIRQRASFLGTADILALATPPGLLLGRLANFTNNELWGRPTDVPWAVIFPGEAAQACPGVVGLCARHPSQLYEALLEGVVLGILMLVLAWRKGWLKRPGALTGVFLAGYGMSRALVEFFRQPDLQFVSEDNPIGHALHFGTWGLTMGQALSLPMIFAGLALICWAFRMQQRDRDQKTTETV